MLLEIYGDKYDFIITNSDRKNGRSILVCPIHGEDIDNEYIFQGKGCPKCITITESNIFYLIKLKLNTDEFYKLGISHYDEKNNIRRFNDYKSLGYNIEIIKIIPFESSRNCKEFELQLKRIIKNDLYVPKIWPHETSTECFKENLLDIKKF